MEGKEMKIGLAFSGGGFRAAAFNLGVISYMHQVDFGQSTLLQQVVALSTVSGGTITGARYAIGIKNQESVEQIYKAIFHFLSQVDIVAESLDRLAAKKYWRQKRLNSLICAFADVYHKELFNQATFGVLLEQSPSIHLKHVSFNATEFDYGMQFRFQISDAQTTGNKYASGSGIIGNHKCRVPESVAKDIRMADILAASSCFPGGFEPINFPDDFGVQMPEEPFVSKDEKSFPVGLMDGGIVDNQGIEPLLLAENRMKRSQEQSSGTQPESNVMDLLIISDVCSPYMDEFKASEQKPKKLWRMLTPSWVLFLNLLCLLGASTGLWFSVLSGKTIIAAICASVITLNLVVFILSWFIGGLPAKLEVPESFLKPLLKFLKIRFVVYESMVVNRLKSVLKMTGDVFLKHIRRLNYNRIFTDNSWKNRRIMNAIYELRTGEHRLDSRIEKGTIPPHLIPCHEVRELAKKAADMGTTLWFTSEELESQNMLNSLIATGQFTICWNLLNYLESIKKDPENTNTSHQALLNCEPHLLQHWLMFQQNPFWLTEKYNAFSQNT